MNRSFIATLSKSAGETVRLCGYVVHLRIHSRTAFLVVRDASGTVQCVGDPSLVRDSGVRHEQPVAVRGVVRPDERAPGGIELQIEAIELLGEVLQELPFLPSADLSHLHLDTVLNYRPLSLRNASVGGAFRFAASIVEGFRDYLTRSHFTEIFSSKLVGQGTEGGANVFEVKYFDRAAYLAQSPQLFKEYGVLGFERVFETGFVYRAEPHASSRHLTEYYSLDVEMGFVDCAEDVIEFERGLLTALFESLNGRFDGLLRAERRSLLPDMAKVPVWEFEECVDRLRRCHARTGLEDDLDPEGERQICAIAEEECGVPAVFVVGYPLSARPFYTHPRGERGAAESFDLLLEGIEITTGGRRLHLRGDLERSLASRGMNPEQFEGHLAMYQLGMPPHGGFAIGLERIVSALLRKKNVREASLFPRDRYRLSP